MRRLLIVTGAAVVLVIALIVVQQVTKSDSNKPDPSNLSGLAEVQAEFDGLTERAGTIGPAGAKVTITEYGDLRCPICKTFDNEVVPTLVENFVRTGQAKMQFKVWPILGPNSVDAAKAAYAAKQQNALWRYASLTYLNQGDENVSWFTPAFARSVAQALGLDLARFDKDRASDAAVTAIDQVNQEATEPRLPGHADDPRERAERHGDRRRHAGGDHRRRAEGERLGRVSARRLAAVLALLELAIAVYLEVERARGRSVACPIGGGGCETVQQSSYSKLAGVPLPILGLIGAATMFVTTLRGRPARTHRRVRARRRGRALLALPRGPAGIRDPRVLRVVPRERRDLDRPGRDDRGRLVPRGRRGMTARLALAALAALLALPASAGAHTIKGLVHDERDVVLSQAPGTHALDHGRRHASRAAPRRCTRRRGARPAGRARAEARCRRRLGAQGRAHRDGALDHDRRAGSARPRLAERREREHPALPLPGHPRARRAPLERAAARGRPRGRDHGCRRARREAAARLGDRRGRSRWRRAWCSECRAAGAPAYALVGALAIAVVAISYGESQATGSDPWGEIVAVVVGLAGLAAAFRLRRDAALEQGVLAVAAILLVLPLIGRLSVLRHGVIVTTLDPDLVRALVIGGLAAASAVITAAARAWWPADSPSARPGA